MVKEIKYVEYEESAEELVSFEEFMNSVDEELDSRGQRMNGGWK